MVHAAGPPNLGRTTPRSRAVSVLPAFLLLVFAVLLSNRSVSALASYTEPLGYLTAPWPDFAAYPYTAQNSPMKDITGNQDASRGASLSGMVDFSSSAAQDQTSFFYWGDGSVLFFRLRVDGPPLALSGSSEPIGSGTWNILLDIDGDGFKEYVVMLDGEDALTEPDDIVVIYDPTQTQRFDIQSIGVWRQDCAGPDDGVNGATGGSSTWDTNADAYVWDFGRIRVEQINRAKAAGSNLSEYWIDIRVPVAAFDATTQIPPGPALGATSFFSLAATTSNSTTDPTQKDLLYFGTFALADVPLPGGDLNNTVGVKVLDPLVTAITASVSCPSVTLTATVIDALKVVAGSTTDTMNEVAFEYSRDGGSTWSPVGAATRTATVGQWQYVWDLATMETGSYLIRAKAVDNELHTTYSTNQALLSPTSVTASFNNACSTVATLDASTKAVTDDNGGQAVPGDVLTWTIVLRNTGTAGATNVVLRDTLDSRLTYETGTASPAPDSPNPPFAWTIGTLAAGATSSPYTFQARLTAPIVDGATVVNRAWIHYQSPAGTNRSRSVTASIAVASDPLIACTKSVSADTAAPGDTLVYTVNYTNTGTDAAAQVVITDSAPATTEYVAGSVALNGVAKTDADDADEVTVSGNTITVTIASVPYAGSGQVTFRARIR